MASGIITGTTSNEYIDSRITWSSTADTSSNTSTVTATLQYKRNNTGYFTDGTGVFSLTIDGTKTSGSKHLTITEGSWVSAITATKTVSHNNNGTKSITISATGYMSGTTLSTTNCSGVVTLDTIPKAGSLMSVATINIGGKNVVDWNSRSASLSYKLRFELGTWNYTTGIISPNTQGNCRYNGNDIPLDVLNQIPNNTKGTVTVTLYTYTDSSATTLVGTDTKTYTAGLPLNAPIAPTGTMTLSPVHSLGSNFSGIYVQGKTKVKATFTISYKYSATKKSITMAVDGIGTYSSSPYQSDLLSRAGDISVVGTVTDSRDQTLTISQTINVKEYSAPRVIPYTGENAVICKRCKQDGTLSDSGTYLCLKVGRKYSPVSVNGVQKNFCLLQYRYKEVSSTSFSDWKTLLAKTNTSTNEINTVISNIVTSTTTSYIVQVKATDDIDGDSSILEFAIPTDAVTLHFREGGKGVGIGRYADEDNILDIAYNWDVRGRVYGLGKGKIDIQSGSDLNNYKEFGVYTVESNIIAQSLTNCPSVQAGTLIVSSGNGSGQTSGIWTYILQKYITFDGKHEYYRALYTRDTENDWIYNDWECRSDTGWTALGLSSKVSAPSTANNYGRCESGNCYYRVVDENHVYVAFNCQTTNTTDTTVNSTMIPDKYRPARKVFAMCATGGRAIARVHVTVDGEVKIEWVQDMTATATTNPTAIYWVDGYIDYWV